MVAWRRSAAAIICQATIIAGSLDRRSLQWQCCLVIQIMQPSIIAVSIPGQNENPDWATILAYIARCEAAGSRVILLSPGSSMPDNLRDTIDGIVLSGGGDLTPSLYAGYPHPSIYNTDENRDLAEFALVESAFQYKIPILGICRGLQVLNVATGGNLIADLESESNSNRHRLMTPNRMNYVTHDVNVLDGNSRLGNAIGKKQFSVMSCHHQAIDRISDCWEITATCEDGVVEAIEHTTHPYAVGVQFHPELGDRDNFRLIESFVNATKEYRFSKN
jgi:putative glutamine amidotransferase